MFPETGEGRLLLVACLLLALLVGLAILGERTLVLFGGDRMLAMRAYKALYVGVGGVMLGLAAPALVAGGAARLSALFVRVRAEGAIAEAVLGHSALVGPIGYTLMALFVLAGSVGALLVWLGIMWPGEG